MLTLLAIASVPALFTAVMLAPGAAVQVMLNHSFNRSPDDVVTGDDQECPVSSLRWLEISVG